MTEIVDDLYTSPPVVQADSFEFADPQDVPVPYMQRTRDWYLGLGYENPYVWAHYAEVPFAPLLKPLQEARVTIITTAAPFQSSKGDQGPGAPYNAGAKFFSVYAGDTAKEHDLRISHVAIDRKHTSMQDSNTWFALPMLKRFEQEKRIGSVAKYFYGAPTQRSHRRTLSEDGPDIVERCRQDGVDAAVLIANCPVCHQTLSLTARLLERAGISTVVMGCAKDVVEYCGVPRFLFSDFPLGNAAGKPGDLNSQRQTLALALALLARAPGPRSTVQSPARWSTDASWKLDYCNIEHVSAEEIAHLRAQFDISKAQAKAQDNAQN